MKKNKGFTLIELILYVAIITIFMAGAVQFAWDILYGRVKTTVQQEVNQNIRLAAQRINYEIRNASDINSATGSTLSLAMSDSARNPTIFDLSDGQLRIGYGSAGLCPTTAPCTLTSNLVSVSDLTFTDLSSGTDSKNIKFDITIEYNNSTNRQEFEKSSTYSSSAELRSN